ncbi:MAG: hypothetical protein IPJ41_00085 [Phycisphaerales bacterium]|nr:hypothetical protein [Phycisphaerales bacterium]
MHERPSPPICAACGYDLSGTPVVDYRFTCPECGGQDVRVRRWFDPRLRARWAWVYLALAAAGIGPPTLAACLLTGRWGSWLSLALLASPPLLLLGAVLASWRPNRVVGLTILGLAEAGAVVLGALAMLALRIPEPFHLLALAPLAASYYVLPAPIGVLLARTMLDTTN